MAKATTIQKPMLQSGSGVVERNLALLARSSRADVHVIEMNGTLAVKKTFRHGCERFLDREIFARRVLSEEFPEIPPILDFGTHHVTSPFIRDILNYRRIDSALMPVKPLLGVLDFLERLYLRGFALIDAHPENFLVDEMGQVVFFDFEFLHRYEGTIPKDFLSSWDVAGPPRSWGGDKPDGGPTSWKTHWYPYVGLTVSEVRTLPGWRQKILRARHWASWTIPRTLDRHLPAAGIQLKHTIANMMRQGRDFFSSSAATNISEKGDSSGPGPPEAHDRPELP